MMNLLYDITDSFLFWTGFFRYVRSFCSLMLFHMAGWAAYDGLITLPRSTTKYIKHQWVKSMLGT